LSSLSHRFFAVSMKRSDGPSIHTVITPLESGIEADAIPPPITAPIEVEIAAETAAETRATFRIELSITTPSFVDGWRQWPSRHTTVT